MTVAVDLFMMVGCRKMCLRFSQFLDHVQQVCGLHVAFLPCVGTDCDSHHSSVGPV